MCRKVENRYTLRVLVRLRATWVVLSNTITLIILFDRCIGRLDAWNAWYGLSNSWKVVTCLIQLHWFYFFWQTHRTFDALNAWLSDNKKTNYLLQSKHVITKKTTVVKCSLHLHMYTKFSIFWCSCRTNYLQLCRTGSSFLKEILHIH